MNKLNTIFVSAFQLTANSSQLNSCSDAARDGEAPSLIAKACLDDTATNALACTDYEHILACKRSPIHISIYRPNGAASLLGLLASAEFIGPDKKNYLSRLARIIGNNR